MKTAKSKHMKGVVFSVGVCDAIRHHIGERKALESKRNSAFEERDAASEEKREVDDHGSDEYLEICRRHSEATTEIDSLSAAIKWHRNQIDDLVETADEPKMEFMYEPPILPAKSAKSEDAEGQMTLGEEGKVDPLHPDEDDEPAGKAAAKPQSKPQNKSTPKGKTSGKAKTSSKKGASGPDTRPVGRPVGKPGKARPVGPSPEMGTMTDAHLDASVSELTLSGPMHAKLRKAGIETVRDAATRDRLEEAELSEDDIKAVLAAADAYRVRHFKASTQAEKGAPD